MPAVQADVLDRFLRIDPPSPTKGQVGMLGLPDTCPVYQGLGVQLLPRFHHGDVVTNRLDLRRTGGNDREETHEDLGCVIGVDYKKKKS